MKHPVLRNTLKTVGVMALAAMASTITRAEEESPFVSGTLALGINTHFISYGADVWGAGTKWEDGLINPSVEFGFALSENVTAILGTWWDVNKNAASNIGNNYVQEVDVWTGLSVASGSLTYTLIYQEWMYASQSERIVDFKIALDHPLSPSFTVHGRVDGEDMDTGAAFVAAIAPGTEAGPLSVSFPVNVAADTDGFHGGDAGFSYASAGISTSLPLEVKGSPSLTAGLTFFYTNDDVIPNNPDDAFVTGSIGISIGF